MVNNEANQSVTSTKLTKCQIAAIVPLIAEACLIPLVIVLFLFGSELSHVASSLTDPPSLRFLRGQYEFLLLRGVDPTSAALPLRLFEVLIWILLPIGLLRLISSPLLFSRLGIRKILQIQGVSIVKFYLIVILLIAMFWLSMDIEGATFVPRLNALLKQSPNTFIFLEACWFAFVALVVFEALVGLVELVVTTAREGIVQT